MFDDIKLSFSLASTPIIKRIQQFYTMQLSRTIIKQKVAVKLFPDSLTSLSAMQRLRREISTTPNLKNNLYGSTNNSRLHHFTNKQVKVLLVHFDITVDEYLEL